MGDDRADTGPAPRALVAVTVHVYVFAVVNPFTVIGVTVPVALTAAPPAVGVHVAA